jgi:hypothetical protein
MGRKTEVTDEDGNIIPPPDPNHPVMAIVWLLEYGRTRGFQIGPHVQVGDTVVTVKDLRQAVANSNRGEPELVPGSDMATLLGDE